ncbi:MAG: tetratricopeptide repeat protein [Sandaracinaceae bacterium]
MRTRVLLVLLALLVASGSPGLAAADPPTAQREARLRDRIARAGGDVDAQLALAELRLRSGDAEGALRELEVTTALSPSAHRARVLRAQAFLALRRPEDALAELDRYVRQTGGDAPSHTLRASVLESLERWEPALADVEAALETESTVDLHLARARLLGRLDRASAAAAALELGLTRHEGAAVLRVALIDALRRLGRPGPALRHVEALITDASVAPRWRVTRAELLDELGRPTEARAERARALRDAERMLTRRRSALALLERGRALLALGREGEARADLEQALRRAPSLTEARVLLARSAR